MTTNAVQRRGFRVGRRSTRTAAVAGGERAHPILYRSGMSKQIAVRIPDDIVDFIDALVRDGRAGSRAIVVRRALERERRRGIAVANALGPRTGHLRPAQEAESSAAINAAFDLA
jgi:Arc/MetJ-type ribon-helix-helix transcriptional regulator